MLSLSPRLILFSRYAACFSFFDSATYAIFDAGFMPPLRYADYQRRVLLTPRQLWRLRRILLARIACQPLLRLSSESYAAADDAASYAITHTLSPPFSAFAEAIRHFILNTLATPSMAIS
jgi:hypothetical protein